jgi:arylsulfatase A-like enzyme
LINKYGDLFPRGIPNLHNLFFILEQAIDWIMAQVVSLPNPFLAYYHLLPPHEPYMTRKDFVGLFDDGWAPDPKPPMPLQNRQNAPEGYLNRSRIEYDEYLAYADEEFGRLYDFMLAHGTLDNTIFVFTSDHGELFERGIRGHVTQALYEPITHVPLMISVPGQKQRQDVFTPTSCVDLLPTLLQLTNQPIPDWCEGQVLPGFGEADVRKSIYTVEAKSNPKEAPLKKATVALVKDNNKIINYLGYHPNESIFEFYDLKTDPDERENLYKDSNSLAADLREVLLAKLKQVNQRF